MNARGPRYDSKEYARRGKEMYDRNVKPTLLPEDHNKFVAIDIESGVFEIDPDDFTASESLLARCPDAQIWIERAGHRAAYRFGFRSRIGRIE
jgi:hypothetical protein